jgi:hypothetical protein
MSRRIAPVDSGVSEPGEGAGHTLRNTEPWGTAKSAQRRLSWAATVEDADGKHPLRRTMSVSTIESGNLSDYTAGFHADYNPIFQSQWDAEFRQHSYSPWPIRIFATVGAVFNMYSAGRFASAPGGFNQALHMFAPRALGSMFLSLHCEHRSYAGVVSCTLTGHVQFVGGAISLLFLAVFCMTSMRLFSSRYYDHLCAAWATSMFIVETVRVDLHGGTY